MFVCFLYLLFLLKNSSSKIQNLRDFNDTSWLLMKKRDAALKKKSHKSGLETVCLIYKVLRCKVTGQFSKAKADFFMNVIKQAKGNTKILWKSIDHLIEKESLESGPELKGN